MTKLTILLAVGVVACGGSKTSPPPDPTGHWEDLRRHLKPEVAAKAPPDDKAPTKDLSFDLRGASVRLAWHTFDDGPNKYLLSVGLEVTKRTNGVTIEAEPAMNPTNAGTEAAIIEEVPLKVKWIQGDSSGEVSFSIRADGAAKKL